MKVLCLGLSQTSTMTMMTALNQLGYRSYHMMATGDPQNIKERHAVCWREALNYKVNGVGAAYGPKDFDKLLQHYIAVSDMPCVNFASELVTAFPKAKIVLTQRDPVSWVKSVDEIIHYVISWKIWPLVSWLSPDGLAAVRDCIQLAVADWTSPHSYTDRKALAAYMPIHTAYMPIHTDHICSLASPGNLLEFHPKDGWEPLCKFLGKPVPDGPFPYVNKGQNAANMIKVGIAIWFVKRSFPYLLGFGAIFIAWNFAVAK